MSCLWLVLSLFGNFWNIICSLLVHIFFTIHYYHIMTCSRHVRNLFTSCSLHLYDFILQCLNFFTFFATLQIHLHYFAYTTLLGLFSFHYFMWTILNKLYHSKYFTWTTLLTLLPFNYFTLFTSVELLCFPHLQISEFTKS